MFSILKTANAKSPAIGQSRISGVTSAILKKTARNTFRIPGRVVVEMARVELASESISTGISPSAVNDLVFRVGGRPLTGCRLRYLVVPCEVPRTPCRFSRIVDAGITAYG